MPDKAQLSTRLKVLAAIAMADGSLDAKERRLLESICDDLGLSRDDLNDALEQRRAVRTEDLPTAPKEKRALLIDAFRVAAADGKVEAREEKLARKVAKALGLSSADVRDCVRAAQQSFEEKPARPTTPAETTHTAEDSVPAVWQVGDVILDLYEVKHIHHSGGMGLVYRVHHKDWNLNLAVKSPRPESFKSERQKENFERECETWIDLGLHPHIVSCYYVRRLGGIPRVFAEYVEGGSLKEWIDDRRLYDGGHEQTLERMLDIAIQFAWGLQYAHEKGLVHQDVKPGNVMMTPDGTAKVTDFGLARAGRVTDEQSHDDSTRGVLVTRKGMTPAYCSPEQANGDRLSPATDLWSWAVSVLEMFTGEVTWPAGQIAGEALENHLEMGPEDQAIPAMPEKLAALLQTCLQQDAAERPESLHAVAATLCGVYAEVVGHEQERQEPKPAELLADALNNKAVSLLDLGRSETNQERAESLYNKALTADPHHLEATYNRGLLLWRAGRVTDDELVRQLEEVRASHEDDWRDEYLLGLVHVERDDVEAAVALLEEVVERTGVNHNAHSMLNSARADCRARHERRLETTKWHAVNAVALSHDDTHAVSGGLLSAPWLWSLLTHDRVRRFRGFRLYVHSLQFSPDGRWVLTGGLRTIRLWDVHTGTCVRKFKGHKLGRISTAFFPDGTRIVSGGGISSWFSANLSLLNDRVVRVWDLATAKCQHKLEGHTDAITHVAVSPDSTAVLSASHDRTLRLWDVHTGRCLQVFEGHKQAVRAASFSPDGTRVLSGSIDATIRLWDTHTGQCLRLFRGHTRAVLSLKWVPGTPFVLSGSRDSTLRLWDTRTGECLRVLGVKQPRAVHCVSFSHDGRQALCGGFTERRASESLCLRSLHGSPIREVVAQPSAEDVLSGAARQVRRLTGMARSALVSGRRDEAFAAVTEALSRRGYERNPDLLQLRADIGAVGRKCGFLSAHMTRTCAGHTSSVRCVAVSPDGRRILSGGGFYKRETDTLDQKMLGYDSAVRLWDASTGDLMRELEGHKSGVTCVVFSPDGCRGLSAGDDKTLRVWDWAAQEVAQTLEGHRKGVLSAAFSPDGKRAVSGGADRAVCLWDTESGECVRTMSGHKKPVQYVRVSDDGLTAVSECQDTLRVWELGTGKCLGCEARDRSKPQLCHLAHSKDARWAFTVGGGVHVWDLRIGKHVRELCGDKGAACVALSADCQYLIVGGTDQLVRVWQLVWDYEWPEITDWDDGALPVLESFLALHIANLRECKGHIRKREWIQRNRKALLHELRCADYGWLRPEGVLGKVEEMTADWA